MAFYLILLVLLIGCNPSMARVDAYASPWLSCEDTYLCSGWKIDSAQAPCRCDDNCLLFHDCCYDAFNDTQHKLVDGQLNSMIRKDWLTCETFGEVSKFVISNCPNNYNDLMVKQLCLRENIPDENYSYLLDLPIMQDDVLYANIYCATCHGVSGVSPTNIVCDQNVTKKELLASGRYLRGTRTWEISNGMHCKLILDENVLTLRNCHPEYVVCPSMWNDHEVAEHCESYILPVVDEKEPMNVYKNSYCAQCNGVRDSKIFCPTGVIFKAFAPPLSLSILFDFSSKRQMENCSDGHDWDPLEEVCQPRTRYISANSNNGTTDNEPGSHVNKSNYHLNNTGNEISDSVDIDMKRYVTTVCLSLSVVSLTLHIILYILLPSRMNPHNTNVFWLCCTLMLAHLLFLFGSSHENRKLCLIFAFFLHFSFFSVLCWMYVISSHICHTFFKHVLQSPVRKHDNNFKCAIYAWGVPALIAFVASIVNVVKNKSILSPKFGERIFGEDAYVCWFGSHFGLAMWFAIPTGLLILINFASYITTVYKVMKHIKAAKQMEKTIIVSGRKKLTFYLYLKLAVIMGVSWIFAFLSAFTSIEVLQYPFIILNGLQGFFIFLVFDVKIQVFRDLCNRLFGVCGKKKKSKIRRGTTETSISLPKIEISGDSNIGETAKATESSIVSYSA